MRINKAIFSTQVIGVFDINDETKVRFVVENAGPSNVIEIRARLLGQPNFYALQTLTGSVNEVINVATYEELQIECTTFDPITDKVNLYAASFNEAGGSAIESIGVPSGSDITNADTLEFTSSDNSINISGDNLTKTIDFTTSASISLYSPDDPSDWITPPTTIAEGLDELADRTIIVETTKINSSEKGAADGVAPLNSLSQIDSIYLPSYVDDVVEYANSSAFPLIGEAGKIYVALDTNLTYRWSGSSYIQISESAVLSVNGQVGVVVLDKTDIGLGNVDNTSDLDKPVSNDTQDALNLKVDIGGDTMIGPLNMSALSENIQFSVSGLNATSNIQIRSDNQTSQNTGNVELTTGNAQGSNTAGSIYLTGGSSVDGNPANIILEAGVSSGTGVNGSIILDSKQVVYLNQNPIGYIDAVNHNIQNVSDPVSPQDAATKNWVEEMSAIDGVIFVSPSASLFGADGSLYRPYVTIAAALATASNNNIIALLPGTYSESTVIIPAVLEYITIRGTSEATTIVNNGFSYTSGSNGIGLLFEKLNIGTLTLDASLAANGLLNFKQVSVAFNRIDTNSNILCVTTESVCFGGTVAGGGNSFSETIMVAPLIVNGGLCVFENTKFVSRVEAHGISTIRLLDCDLFGASEFVNGNLIGLDSPTIEIDTASDALGSLVGYFTKVLLAQIPLSNITQSSATSGEVPVWNGSAWVADNISSNNVNYTPVQNTDWLTVPSLVNTALDELADRVTSLDVGSVAALEIFEDTNEPTGFLNRDDSVISFDDLTRTFTIQPALTSFQFYIQGTKFEKNSAENLVITTDDGNHYIYYDQTGSLASTTIFSIDIIKQNAFVAIIYWNSEINQHVYFAEERHGITMDGETHSYFHTVLGARYLSGLALQGFTVDGAGSSDSDAQFTSDSGTIRDEDILHVLPAQTQIPVYYRQGQLWRRKSPDLFPFIYSGTAGYTGASGRIPYNEYTGGAWQLTEIANNAFVLVHFFATNDIDDHVIAIQGTNTYGNVTAARVAAATEISALVGLPFAEFVAIGSVVLESSDSFSNTPAAIVRSVNGGDYIDFRGTQLYTPAGEATTHGLLSGLANDDHPQYLTDARGDIRYYTKAQIDSDVIKKTGVTAFTADQSMGGYKLTNVANPVALTDAVNLQTLNAALGASGDILENSFSLADGQSSLTDITSFIFPNATVRSFDALVSISILAASNLYETIEIKGIQKDSGWQISISSTGDVSGVILEITSAGQMQYITPTYSGFTSGTLKFRAITTSI